MLNTQSWISKTFPYLPIWVSILCMLIPIIVAVWVSLKFWKTNKSSTRVSSKTIPSRRSEWLTIIVIVILFLVVLGAGYAFLLFIIGVFKEFYDFLLGAHIPRWLAIISIVGIITSILYFLIRRRFPNLLPTGILNNRSLSKSIIYWLMVIASGILIFYGARYLFFGTETRSNESSSSSQKVLPYVPTYTMVTTGTHTYVKGTSYSFVLTDDRDFYLDPISDGEVTFTYVNITHPHTWKVRKTKNGDDIDRTIIGTISAYNNDKVLVSVDKTADINVQIVNK